MCGCCGICCLVPVLLCALGSLSGLCIHQPRLGKDVQKGRAGQAFLARFISPSFATVSFKNRFSRLCPFLRILLPCPVHCLLLQSVLHMGNHKIAPELLHWTGSALFSSKLNFFLAVICKKRPDRPPHLQTPGDPSAH